MTNKEIDKILNYMNIDGFKYLKDYLDPEKKLSRSPLAATYDARFFIEQQIIKMSELQEMLLSEKKYNELKSQKKLSNQKLFEKYITTVLYPGYNKANYYGEIDNLFTFTNGASIYQLNEPFLITPFITDKQRKGSRWEHRSAEAPEELEDLLLKFEEFLIEKLLVEFTSVNPNNKTTYMEHKHVMQEFYNPQLIYFDKFLGDNVKTYICYQNPILYGESDKGKGYLLGLKKNT